MSLQDKRFMDMALAEAVKGLGRTSPNPLVGAVVVGQDGVVLGMGHHRFAGGPHAEVYALDAAGSQAAGATLYVTLEPCNHTGRTPPCTEAILRAGISRVVVGMADPNPAVAGGGAGRLARAGVKVDMPVEERACRRINYPFLKHAATGMPWVVLKAGMSLDGCISFKRGTGGAVTGPASHRKVHERRDRTDAILIGIGTALIDSPSLTTRLAGALETRDPLRIVLDTDLRLSPDAVLLTQQSSAETWVLCSPDAPVQRERAISAAGGKVLRVERARGGGLDLKQVLRVLGSDGISSVLVEGGATVHGAFLAARLVDEVCLFVAPFFIGDSGTPVVQGFSCRALEDAHRLMDARVEPVGDDFMITGYLNYP